MSLYFYIDIYYYFEYINNIFNMNILNILVFDFEKFDGQDSFKSYEVLK